MKKSLVLLLVGVFCLMSANVFAFATITAPQGGDTIILDTNVNDVDVYMNGVLVGRKGTNSFVYKAVRNGEDKVITFKKEGYQDESVTLQKSMTPMFWGNLLIGGTLGSSTDSIFTKNSTMYSPGQYFVKMRKI